MDSQATFGAPEALAKGLHQRQQPRSQICSILPKWRMGSPELPGAPEPLGKFLKIQYLKTIPPVLAPTWRMGFPVQTCAPEAMANFRRLHHQQQCLHRALRHLQKKNELHVSGRV
ncbi:hypothetical protein CYMTET_17288 [Cymbomonas tetramitiformis]|uniref:Uncharacterized protein n=1 Tax=Cymbomonas tetramitiformis TaxID=36881 RepID=A0AAE0L741_9CHLO|nr:hypothetical protein CYMTET_17288 [Cymbomonas tetramitiformis]